MRPVWLLVLGLLLLTRPDGKQLWFVDTNIVVVTSASSKVGGPPSANAVVYTANGFYWVRETPFAIARKLGWKP